MIGGVNQKVAKAEREMRKKWITLCYYYPQYKMSDFHDDLLTTGDVDAMISLAELKYHEKLRDMLFVTTGATNKKGYNAVLRHLKKRIKELEQSL